MIQEQAAAAASQGKRGKKEESMQNLGLEEEKTAELYGILPLEGEYNYNIVLRMTS